MSELTKLRDDHAQLARMFLKLEHIIEQPHPPAELELYEFRRSLMTTVIAHLKLEDWALYPRLIASEDEEVSRAGQAFKDEMGGLAPAFIRYCDQWTAGSITENWPAYCVDTRNIVDALMNRLTRENRELLPLLERIDRAA